MDQLEAIEESIRNHKYDQIVKAGKLNENTLRELGYFSKERKKSHFIKEEDWVDPNKASPAKDIPLYHKMGNAVFKVKEDKFKISKMNFLPQQTFKKLVKHNENQNMKQLDLHGMNLFEDE